MYLSKSRDREKKPPPAIGAHARIESVAFGLLSSQDVIDLSVVQIDTEKLYNYNKLPAENGLLDTRMGPWRQNGGHWHACVTCNQTSLCPGHMGHILLAESLLHPRYARLCMQIIQSECSSCGELLLNAFEHQAAMSIESSEERRAYVLQKAAAKTTCPAKLKGDAKREAELRAEKENSGIELYCGHEVAKYALNEEVCASPPCSLVFWCPTLFYGLFIIRYRSVASLGKRPKANFPPTTRRHSPLRFAGSTTRCWD
jgi:hypothetical protein